MRNVPTSGSAAECLSLLDGLDLPAFVIDRHGSLVFRNENWQRGFAGIPTEHWSWLDSVHDSAHRLKRIFSEAIVEERRIEVEFQLRRADGYLVMLACMASPFVDHESGITGMLAVCWDITERALEEQRLAFMAGHDPLTGLANRRAFEEALSRAVYRAARGASPALLIIDLDRLKQFNDVRGHLDGDQALVNLAMLLRTHVRAGDLPARIGGDEFVVLLEDATVDEACEIAERVRATASEEEFVPGARDIGLGVSIGIVQIEAGIEPRTLMDRADAALYVAKREGRNRVELWRPDSGLNSAAERLATRVSQAFAHDGFRLVYQPIVRLSDGRVSYFESLVRMVEEDGSFLTPDEFLPVVDRLGLMSKLTRRIVDLAMWELAAAPDATVSINLAAADLGDHALLSEVERLIAASPATQGRLLFEIGESVLLSNLSGGREWMRRLSPLDTKFVLDGFGTGIGMFVLLREPHVHMVKLSRTVTRALSEERATREFVSALRELIESQGKTAVAAFVETADLLDEAMQAGFSFGQGFHVSEPSADLAALVASLRDHPLEL